MNNKIDFKLSDTESLEFVSDGLPIDQVYMCRNLEIYWREENFLLHIGTKSAGDMALFAEHFSAVIDGNLRLHSSIQQDLGYLWNEELQGNPGLFYVSEKDEKSSYWVGLNYFLCSNGRIASRITTWLYNDEQGNIILEATPVYKWSMLEYDPADGFPFVSYEDFMKDYKLIFKKIIPKQVAQRWLLQAQQLYEVFYENEQMCRK